MKRSTKNKKHQELALSRQWMIATGCVLLLFVLACGIYLADQSFSSQTVMINR